MPIITALLIFSFSLLFPKNTFADSQILINEFLAHPTSGENEWVEFYNPQGVDLSAYFLDDDTDFENDSGSTGKKSLSTITTPTSIYPVFEFSSFLNNGGDFVVLFSQDGTIIDQYQYTEDPGTDVSIGRSPDGAGSFANLSSKTKGSQNTAPQPSPSPTPPQETPLQITTATSGKSPSPTPKNSPITTLVKASPLSIKSSSKVLGDQKEATPSPSNSTSPSPTPSPSPSPNAENSPKTKIAGIMTGSGAIIIGVAAAAFLWQRKKQSEKEQQN